MSERRPERRPGKAHVELLSNASEKLIPKDNNSSTDDTTISLTSSADRVLRTNNDDFMNLENMRRHGWCNADGTPWMVSRPKDEADLLRRGLVNVHGNRMPSGAPPNLPEGYFDEIELLKKRFTNKQRSISPNQEYEKNKENANRTMMCGHYGVGNDPSVENYITDAEVNTRGYKDRLGRVFYGIPLLKDPKEKATKAANVPAAQNVVVTNNRSERSIRDYNPNVQTISSEPFSLEKSSDDSSSDTSDVHNAELSMRSGIHAIDCNVGKGADCGRLRYLIQRDGRSYQLQGPHNEEVFLEFNKKGASLTSTFIGKSKSKWIGVRSKRKSKEESSSAIEI